MVNAATSHDFPAGAQHISAAEIQDKQYADHGDDPVQRRHDGIPDIRLYG